jgi:hypothetical protein
MATDDWRLTNQETYLKGRALVRRAYNAPRPDWDHDHCEFCWAKFSTDPRIAERLTEDYVTDDEQWICEPCFADYAAMFERVVTA